MRIALIGFGAINRQVASVLAEQAPEVEIAAVGLGEAGQSVPELPRARVFTDPAELADIAPDLVVEAASRAAVPIWAEAALTHAKAFIVSSASALSDDALYDRLERLAKVNGSRLIISSGAVGGIDALNAVSYVGVERLHHQIVKPAKAWHGTEAEGLIAAGGGSGRVSFFTGSAREAGDRFPANANVAVVTAKSSGVGLDDAVVELVSDPEVAENRHVVTATGAFGRISAEMHNRPLASNPKSSQLAAMALVRLITAQLPGVRF